MAAAYDTFDYPAYWESRKYEHESEIIAIKAFLAQIPKITSIGEIGSGYGRLLPLYLFRAKKIILTDPSAKLLGLTKKQIAKDPDITKRKKRAIKLIHSKIENLRSKVKGKSLDVAIMVRVMHHIEDIDKAAEVLSQLVAPNGYLILEFPNKLHGKAILTNFIKGNLTFPLEIFPEDKRSLKNIKANSIPFLNFHPDTIAEILKKHRFVILEKRSVSNVRLPSFKNNIPLSTLLWLEAKLQKPLAYLNFGPSIFVLARRRP